MHFNFVSTKLQQIIVVFMQHKASAMCTMMTKHKMIINYFQVTSFIIYASKHVFVATTVLQQHKQLPFECIFSKKNAFNLPQLLCTSVGRHIIVFLLF